MKTTEKQFQLINDLIDNTRFLIDLDIMNIVSYSDNVDDLEDKITESIFQHEIIYYSEAFKFLSQHDQSLTESLEIASEYSYTTENLNSEILATLLIQKYMIDELSEIIEELKEILEEEETEEN